MAPLGPPILRSKTLGTLPTSAPRPTISPSPMTRTLSFANPTISSASKLRQPAVRRESSGRVKTPAPQASNACGNRPRSRSVALEETGLNYSIPTLVTIKRYGNSYLPRRRLTCSEGPISTDSNGVHRTLSIPLITGRGPYPDLPWESNRDVRGTLPEGPGAPAAFDDDGRCSYPPNSDLFTASTPTLVNPRLVYCSTCVIVGLLHMLTCLDHASHARVILAGSSYRAFRPLSHRGAPQQQFREFVRF
jgi:hypothetical protein